MKAKKKKTSKARASSKWAVTVDNELVLTQGDAELVLMPSSSSLKETMYTSELSFGRGTRDDSRDYIRLETTPKTLARAKAQARTTLRKLVKDLSKLIEKA